MIFWGKSFIVVKDSSNQIAENVSLKLINNINKERERSFRSINFVIETITGSIEQQVKRNIKYTHKLSR
jgi:hypothetical protein